MTKKTYCDDLSIKLMLIGDSDVGKNCILKRYVDDIFYKPTFGHTRGMEVNVKTVELRGKEIKVMIWNPPGQEGFRSITTSYLRSVAGIMIVYDITNEESFENIVRWLKDIDKSAKEDVETMILGNKCDMFDKRTVNKERGETFASEHGIRFMETSAKDNINIDKAFNDLAEAILDKRADRETEDHGGLCDGHKNQQQNPERQIQDRDSRLGKGVQFLFKFLLNYFIRYCQLSWQFMFNSLDIIIIVVNLFMIRIREAIQRP